jgi:hypothetical protein
MVALMIVLMCPWLHCCGDSGDTDDSGDGDRDDSGYTAVATVCS